MHTIHVNYTDQIITFEVSGLITKEEADLLSKGLAEALYQFAPRDVLVLIGMELLDPVPQECLPFFAIMIDMTLTHAKKVASINKRVVTRMQMDRITQSIMREHNDTVEVVRFNTRQEAMRYLKK